MDCAWLDHKKGLVPVTLAMAGGFDTNLPHRHTHAAWVCCVDIFVIVSVHA